jgi:hypothetical protein
MSELYAGDIGATIIIDLKITDIPVTTDFRVIVWNPTGMPSEWVLETGELNRSIGIITHKSKAGELEYDGEYQVQCREVSDTPSTDVGTTIDTFVVLKKISIQVPKDLEAIYHVETA